MAGEYNKNKADGMYRCGGCGAELYKCVFLYDLFGRLFSVAAATKTRLSWTSLNIAQRTF